MKRTPNTTRPRLTGEDAARFDAWVAARRAAAGAPVEACICGCMHPAVACGRALPVPAPAPAPVAPAVDPEQLDLIALHHGRVAASDVDPFNPAVDALAGREPPAALDDAALAEVYARVAELRGEAERARALAALIEAYPNGATRTPRTSEDGDREAGTPARIGVAS